MDGSIEQFGEQWLVVGRDESFVDESPQRIGHRRRGPADFSTDRSNAARVFGAEEPEGNVEPDAVEWMASPLDGTCFGDGHTGLNDEGWATDREVAALIKERHPTFTEDHFRVVGDALRDDEFVTPDRFSETPSERPAHPLGEPNVEGLVLNDECRCRRRDSTTHSELLTTELQTPHRGAEALRRSLYGIRDHSYNVHGDIRSPLEARTAESCIAVKGASIF